MAYQYRELESSEVNEDTTAGTRPVGDRRVSCSPLPEPDFNSAAAASGLTGPFERHIFSHTKGKTFGEMAKSLLTIFQSLRLIAS